jgi:tripartite-type tricarboxylate transporter receptor subunit TctC
MVRAAIILAASVWIGLAASGNAVAELLSSRPITIVIPFTPGASADTLQRLVAKKVSDNTGQVIVIDSRGGGGGVIGAMVVKQAAPDGHTLFQANAGTHAANVSLYDSLPYDPVKDFEPVTLQWSFPNILVVPVDSPAKSVADLVVLAKSKPGGLSFASQGSGSGGHLLGEMLKARTGTTMVHVPYRGAGPAVFDTVAGRVDFFFVSYASALSFVQSGKLRVLAVTTPKRIPALPDVPTMAEAGYAGLEVGVWFGLVAPAGTPAPIVGKLHDAFAAAVHDPEVLQQFAAQGVEAATSTPAEFRGFIASETERLGKIVRAIGVKASE